MSPDKVLNTVVNGGQGPGIEYRHLEIVIPRAKAVHETDDACVL